MTVEELIERKGFGRISRPDDRDHRFPMSAMFTPDQTRDMPPSKYWRTQKVRDQGNSSTCVAQSWRHFLEAAPIMTKPTNGVGINELYKAAQEVDEWEGESYEGTSVRAGAKVLQARGHLQSYVWAFDDATVQKYVLTQGPVVIGTTWYEGMMIPDENGFIRPTGANLGGHACLVVGFDNKRDAFRILNSWGPGWGQTGRAWLPKTALHKLMQDDGEACAAIEIKISDTNTLSGAASNPSESVK